MCLIQSTQGGIKSVALVLYCHLATMFTPVKLAPIRTYSGIESGIITQGTLAVFLMLFVFQQQGVANHCHKAVSTALLQMT